MSPIHAVESSRMTSVLEPTATDRGILADASRIEPWLHITVVLLTAASAVRYVNGHGFGDNAGWVLSGAAVLLGIYAFPRLVRTGSARWVSGWCLALVVTWFALVLLAPSFSWVAVPLSFVALRVLPFVAAGAVIAAMVATVVTAWVRMAGRLDPTIVAGPVCIALLAVVAYRTLERAGSVRQQLVEELSDVHSDLAEAQHRAGALSERARLSRDIHDSVAQGFTSINLLLQAADQSWSARPDAARESVAQAALTAREGLDEIRRVIGDLAPAELTSNQTATALFAALRRSAEQAVRDTGISIEVLLHGDPTPVAPEVAAAVLRTARGALANVVEHSGATGAVVSLTYQADCLTLDVYDDGTGFAPSQPPRVRGRGRGRGLAGIQNRVHQLGGELVVESAPGEGTTIAVSVPLQPAKRRDAR